MSILTRRGQAPIFATREKFMGTSLFTKLFGTKQDKDLKSLKPLVELVNKEAAWAESLSAEEVRQQTQSFKEQVAQGTSLDSLLPKAFALAREAASRVLGERHYDVQIMGAAVLHQGKILEMKTGEGKNSYLCTGSLPECSNRQRCSCSYGKRLSRRS